MNFDPWWQDEWSVLMMCVIVGGFCFSLLKWILP